MASTEGKDRKKRRAFEAAAIGAEEAYDALRAAESEDKLRQIEKEIELSPDVPEPIFAPPHERRAIEDDIPDIANADNEASKDIRGVTESQAKQIDSLRRFRTTVKTAALLLGGIAKLDCCYC